MPYNPLTASYSQLGTISCRAVFILGLAYAATTSLGFLSLKSPQEPIGNPYFTIMEVLILLIAPFMAISMVCVHYYAAPANKANSLMALLFMVLATGLTSSVHFVILTIGIQREFGESASSSISFTWPSVVYALDILAWDWFFSLSMLFAAPVFKKRLLRVLLILCGLLSLVGLMGIPLNNMQIRNIGIIGYGVLGPIVFILMEKTLNQSK